MTLVRKGQEVYRSTCRNATREDIAKWACRAVGPGGEGHWELSNPDNVRRFSLPVF